jgi:LysM repeat protein
MGSSENDKDKDFVFSGSGESSEMLDASEEAYYQTGSSSFSQSSAKHLLIAGVGFLILIILTIVVLARTYTLAEKTQLLALESRIEQLKNRLDALPGDVGSSQTGASGEQLSMLANRLDQLESNVTARIDNIIKEINTIAPKPIQRAIKKEDTTAQVPASKKETKPKIHTVRPGETLYRISRQYGLTVDQLRKYNKLGPDASIQPGQELQLTPPKTN